MPSAPRLGTLAGSAGGLAMILTGLALQPLTGLPALPELLQDRLVTLTPGPLFGLLIDRLQTAGRPLLYSSLLLVELVALSVVGALAVALAPERRTNTLPLPRRPLLRTVLLAILLWLGIGLVVLPLAGLGPFALRSRFASAVIFWGYFLESLLFSTVTWLVLAALERPGVRAVPLGAAGADPRRRGLAAGIIIAAVATLGGTALRRYQAEPTSVTGPMVEPVVAAALPADTLPTAAVPAATAAARPALATAATGTASTAAPAVGAATPAGTATAASGSAAASPSGAATVNGMTTGAVAAPTPAITGTPLITPTDAFYVVSKNLDDPVVKAEGWKLSMKGLVKTPFTLSYQELTALPGVEQYRTLACISNDVGGSLMSNARWRGVPLATLLDTAGADPGAGFVLFTSADDYTESLPMALAQQATTLVAYQMNGAPLPAVHGFPARIILAGRYGMKNPKWLTAITIAKVDSPGFWEQQGWDEQAVVRTTSRIDAPADGAVLPATPLAISGVAYAGDRGIKGVQVQLTAGGSWQDAAIQAVTAVSTWTAWRYTWTPAAGDYHISVRASDGNGMLQVAQAQDSYPLGAAGLHTITVHVR